MTSSVKMSLNEYTAMLEKIRNLEYQVAANAKSFQESFEKATGKKYSKLIINKQSEKDIYDVFTVNCYFKDKI